ncbi:MAG: transcriptional regulator, partial [Gemmatimonadaceae bacterium]
HWTLLMANRMVAALLGGIPAALPQPPVNVVRLTLHPKGLAPRIRNLRQWRTHVLERVAHQAALSADQVLIDLLAELKSFALPRGSASDVSPNALADGGDVFVPLQLESDVGVLSLISTTTVFGTPIDITLAELALECFFPADTATAERLRAVAAANGIGA